LIRKASALLLCLTYRKLIEAIKKETLYQCIKVFSNPNSDCKPLQPVESYVLAQGCPLVRKDELVYIWLSEETMPAGVHLKTQLFNNKRKHMQSEEYLLTYILETKVHGKKEPENGLWLGVYQDKIPVLLKSIQNLESLPDPVNVQIFMDLSSSKLLPARVKHLPLKESLTVQKSVLTFYPDLHQKSLVCASSMTSVEASLDKNNEHMLAARVKNAQNYPFVIKVLEQNLVTLPKGKKVISTSHYENEREFSELATSSVEKASVTIYRRKSISLNNSPSTNCTPQQQYQFRTPIKLDRAALKEQHNSKKQLNSASPTRPLARQSGSAERSSSSSKVRGNILSIVRIRTLSNSPKTNFQEIKNASLQ